MKKSRNQDTEFETNKDGKTLGQVLLEKSIADQYQIDLWKHDVGNYKRKLTLPDLEEHTIFQIKNHIAISNLLIERHKRNLKKAIEDFNNEK